MLNKHSLNMYVENGLKPKWDENEIITQIGDSFIETFRLKCTERWKCQIEWDKTIKTERKQSKKMSDDDHFDVVGA